jgi:hypothetical protein
MLNATHLELIFNYHVIFADILQVRGAIAYSLQVETSGLALVVGRL